MKLENHREETREEQKCKEEGKRTVPASKYAACEQSPLLSQLAENKSKHASYRIYQKL